MKAYFDHFAKNYEQVLERSLDVTGEESDFFANARVILTRSRLERSPARPRSAIDFGCGIGTSVPLLQNLIGLEQVVGIDVSREILAEAAKRHPQTRFFVPEDFSGSVDLVFSNGVFHHIEPAERPAALAFIRRVLRPGGHFVLWENNPWNPGTRFIMNRCEFDRDAHLLSIRHAAELLKAAGFTIRASTSAFFFPRSLAGLRFLEPFLAGSLLGGQYALFAQSSSACR